MKKPIIAVIAIIIIAAIIISILLSKAPHPNLNDYGFGNPVNYSNFDCFAYHKHSRHDVDDAYYDDHYRCLIAVNRRAAIYGN
jgi:hypothetical protein